MRQYLTYVSKKSPTSKVVGARQISMLPTGNSAPLQPIHSPLKNLARKQKRENIQYRK